MCEVPPPLHVNSNARSQLSYLLVHETHSQPVDDKRLTRRIRGKAQVKSVLEY